VFSTFISTFKFHLEPGILQQSKTSSADFQQRILLNWLSLEMTSEFKNFTSLANYKINKFSTLGFGYAVHETS